VTITDSFGCTDTDTFTVGVNPLPNVAITGNSTICAGVNDTLVASGGVIYSWNTGDTNDTLIVNLTTATGYTVTVTDANGCSDTASIFVNVNPLPIANIDSGATICKGGSTTLTGSGNGTYLWTPGGQTTPSITVSPTSTATYTLAVTNSCGTAYDTAVVTVNPLPDAVIIGISTICIGMVDTLVATGGVTYQWNTGSNNDSIFVNPTTATGYTVTVTDTNGCSSSTTFTVHVSSVTASITGTNAICSGDSVVLAASGGGTYLWNTGDTNSSITVGPTSSTVYTVVVTNAVGCTDIDTFSITVTPTPVASVTATATSLCYGSSTTLIASGGATYQWSPTTGLNNPNISNPIATPPSLSNITYTVVVSNSACIDTATITITVNPLPTVSISVAPSSAVICNGDTAVLTASGGTNYVWAPGGQNTTTISVSPSSSTTYTVVATDANGCSNMATVTINVTPGVNITVSGNTTICAGDQTILTAQGGSSYVWNPGGQTSSSIVVSPSTNTTYTVVASINGACPDTGIITVVTYPLPTAVASTSPNTINMGGTSTLTGTTSTGTWNWAPGSSLSCTQCPNPVASPTATTTYTLCVTDANNCMACDTVTVLVTTDECGNIFLPNAFSPNNDGVNDFFCLRGYGSRGGGPCTASPCIREIDFSIYNRWGEKVFHTTTVGEGWDGTIKGKEADPAVFFYVITYKTASDNNYHKLEGNVSLIR
jgi:gliding motility-associated-like protein